MSKKPVTNQQIFKRAIDTHPLYAGILREALSHYAELIEEWKPTEKELKRSFVEPNYWKQSVKECKELIDKLYTEAR